MKLESSNKGGFSVAALVFVVCLLSFPSNSAADVSLLFSSGNYGLHGDGSGDSSSLLFDGNGIDSCHLITQNIAPAGGRVHIANTLGINAPGSDGDNLFEPSGAESWTFFWDRDVVLNSMGLLRVRLSGPSGTPMVLSVRSDAWLGNDWVYNSDQTNRVYGFDSLTGTFTFTGYPTNTESQTRFTFVPSEAFDAAALYVPAGTSITFRNEGLTYAAIRGMNFQIVPEPTVGWLCIVGASLLVASGCGSANRSRLRR